MNDNNEIRNVITTTMINGDSNLHHYLMKNSVHRVDFMDVDGGGDHGVDEKDSKEWRNKLLFRGNEIKRQETHLSLLGKPINYKVRKADAKYRRMQNMVYNFLERPRGCRATFYHVLT